MVVTVPEIRKRFFGYKPVERPPTSYPRECRHWSSRCMLSQFAKLTGCLLLATPSFTSAILLDHKQQLP